MTILSIEEFSGEAPKLHPERLAPDMSTHAANVRLDRGILESWREPDRGVAYSPQYKSLYRYQGNWLLSPKRLDYVDTLLPNDPYDRIYYTGDTYPKIQSGGQVFRLGLPRPGAPAVTVAEKGDTENPTNIFSCRYAVTLVDGFGMEGPTSLVTSKLELGSGFSVSLDLTPCKVSGAYNLNGNAKIRIYRSNSGSSSAVLQYVAEVPYSRSVFVDTVPRGDLQEAAVSMEWVGPPDDDTSLYPDGPLKGLLEIPGGMLAGYTGNTVYLSEPYVPSAWPYSYSNEHQIVGMLVTQSGLMVLTDHGPYLLAGSSPSIFTRIPVESDQGCVSTESVVDMGGYGIYASKDGLVLVEGAKAQLITNEIIDRDSWQEFEPSTIRAFEYEGKYIAFYGAEDSHTGFVFDIRGGKKSFVRVSGYEVVAAHYTPEDDQYNVLTKVPGNGFTYLGQFNEGDDVLFVWRSKRYYYKDPVSLGCMKLRADQYPVVVKVFMDGVQGPELLVTHEESFRLPGGFRAQRWEFEISAVGGEVKALYVAESMRELP